MLGRKIANQYKGKTVAQLMVKKNLDSPNSAGINFDTVPHSTSEGAHNYSIQKYRSFYQGLNVLRMTLPMDNKDSQVHRQLEWNRQASMPWGNTFMVTPTDKDRLNNPAQIAAMKQHQLAAPNTYGQFYAFMKALSAAFGTIQGTP